MTIEIRTPELCNKNQLPQTEATLIAACSITYKKTNLRRLVGLLRACIFNPPVHSTLSQKQNAIHVIIIANRWLRLYHRCCNCIKLVVCVQEIKMTDSSYFFKIRLTIFRTLRNLLAVCASFVHDRRKVRRQCQPPFLLHSVLLGLAKLAHEWCVTFQRQVCLKQKDLSVPGLPVFSLCMNI